MNRIIADLQIHSKYARAVSQHMVVPQIANWAVKKSIGLMATGDWTHPLWLRELKANLKEDGSGLLNYSDSKFLLSGEVSCIYSQGGKVRRIHTLIFAPDFATVDKINAELVKRGCNLMSDGRPIIGLTSIQLAEVVFSNNPDCLVIPAHCLLPDMNLIGKDNKPKPIKDFIKDDLVLTHTGTFKKVEKIMVREYQGQVLTIKPWYFREGLTTTPEHPYYAIKTLKKCPSTGDMCRPSKSHLSICKRKTSLDYKKEWIKADELEVGDVIAYPRQKIINNIKRVKISKIPIVNSTNHKDIPASINITPNLGRLLGYYLAEGHTDCRDCISFCFSNKEKDYISDVKSLVLEIFGIKTCREYSRKGSQGVELTFFSKVLSFWFANICYADNKIKRANTKQIPEFFLEANLLVQAELIRGWYRGDKGYTSSRVLMNQLKMLFIRLGIIPSIIIDRKEDHHKRGKHNYGNREIVAQHDIYSFSNLSFFEDKYNLKKEIPHSQTKLDRKHGWIDENYIYLPIKNIEKSDYKGKVYNLEVENDHSYTTEFACVHNCWTPWFSLYGSMSGFDSITEAFGPYANKIYAIETGLSSDPAMNWRIKDLDNRSILSFSDAHSGPKIGREATVFDLPELSFKAIRDAIINQKIAYTIEFYPEEGKYHYTGHRNCNIRQSPTETKKLGAICSVCGKPLTVGVMHRVEELAGRSEEDLKLVKKDIPGTKVKGIYSEAFPQRPPYVMLVPLQEILAESVGSAVTTEKVQSEYNKLTSVLGGEFNVLLKAEISDISKISGERTAEGIDKVRKGNIVIDPGYDGVFGVVKIWSEGKEEKLVEDEKEQLSLF